MKRQFSNRSHGFTMVEMIMVIAITGILAGILAVFIARPVQGYTDSVRRAMLADAADVALRRLSREVRLALPNSLRLTTLSGVTYLEFIPTVTGGRYRDVGDGSTSGNFLDFADSATLTFDVLGPMVAPVAPNDFIVVYNLGEGYAPADAYQGGNRAVVGAVGGSSITLNANIFALQTPALPSPDSRFQVVDDAVQAVTYACPTTTAGNMVRSWNYGFSVSQVVPPGGTSAIAARNVICNFDYQPAVQRTGLLSIQLTFAEVVPVTLVTERATIFQQVRVDNVP